MYRLPWKERASSHLDLLLRLLTTERPHEIGSRPVRAARIYGKLLLDGLLHNQPLHASLPCGA